MFLNKSLKNIFGDTILHLHFTIKYKFNFETNLLVLSFKALDE